MRRFLAFAAVVSATMSLVAAPPVRGAVRLNLSSAPGLSAATLDYLPTSAGGGNLRGIVVFVPGRSGQGAGLLAERAWSTFARDNGLILAEFAFAPDPEAESHGTNYCDTAMGSGTIALEGLKKLGAGRVPVFMYGFSDGANFTASFAENFAKSLKGWCAASCEGEIKAVAPDYVKIDRPCGLMFCGSEDPVLDAESAFYESGRSATRLWTWAVQDGHAHSRSPELEEFVRKYFLSLLRTGVDGVWVDLMTGEKSESDDEKADRSQQTWLPSEQLIEPWKKLTARKTSGLVEHGVKTGITGYEKMTFFMKLPENVRPAGVLCISASAEKPADVRKYLASPASEDKLLDFAAKRNFAVVAWSAKRLWSPSKNVDELPEGEANRAAAEADLMARAWDTAMERFVKRYGIPESGYLMSGMSGAAQFAQRLAQLRPERFLAVHLHMAGSYDVPSDKCSSILWCVTTGENEKGCARSREFFQSARNLRYPIIYKAYQGLGNEARAQTPYLCIESFDFACTERARAMRINEGKDASPDWADIFSSSAYIADIFNQAVYSKFDYACVPLEFRMLIPTLPLCKAWARE